MDVPGYVQNGGFWDHFGVFWDHFGVPGTPREVPRGGFWGPGAWPGPQWVPQVAPRRGPEGAPRVDPWLGAQGPLGTPPGAPEGSLGVLAMGALRDPLWGPPGRGPQPPPGPPRPGTSPDLTGGLGWPRGPQGSIPGASRRGPRGSWGLRGAAWARAGGTVLGAWGGPPRGSGGWPGGPFGTGLAWGWAGQVPTCDTLVGGWPQNLPFYPKPLVLGKRGGFWALWPFSPNL